MSNKLVIRYVRVSTFEQTTDKYKKEDDEKNGIHTIEEKISGYKVGLFDREKGKLIKQMILEMNMSLQEIYYYGQRLTHNMVMPDSIASKNAKKDMPAFEDLRKLEQKMQKDYDIEYWLMDVISPDYDKLLKKIKGKTVFFDATNIFCYHMSHAYYTLDELVSSYKKLHDVLKLSDKTYFRGNRPTKQRDNRWIS